MVFQLFYSKTQINVLILHFIVKNQKETRQKPKRIQVGIQLRQLNYSSTQGIMENTELNV